MHDRPTRPADRRPTILEVLILDTRVIRAYAVGSAFSSRDADGSNDFAWRQVAFNSDDYTYRRPAPPHRRTGRTQRRRATSVVSTHVDPTKIRTLDQQRAVARSL